MERALAWRHLVDACVQTETVTPVLQADAEFGFDAAGAKAHVVALDEAHHHAVLIGSGEVNRAALDRIASAEILRFFHVDEFGARGQIRVVQHLIDGDFHRRWLSHVFVHVGKGQLHGLDLQVL